MVIFVGICGATGTGKSSICKKLASENKGWLHFCLDNFFIGKDRFKQAGNWLDMENPSCTDFNAAYQVLAGLKQGLEAEMPVYSRREGKTTDSIIVRPAEVTLVDGYHTFYDARIVRLLDYKIFLYASEETLKKRRLERDPGIDKGYLNDFLFHEYSKYSGRYESLADIMLSAMASIGDVARMVYLSIEKHRI